MSYVIGSPNLVCHCFVPPFLMWFEFKTGYVLELKTNCLLIGPVRIIFSKNYNGSLFQIPKGEFVAYRLPRIFALDLLHSPPGAFCTVHSVSLPLL
jgi:hypothetical protein